MAMREVAANVAQFGGHAPTGASIEDRLASVGAGLLQWVLAGETIGLARLAIAEASRFPDLASSAHRVARERSAEALAPLLREVAQSAELGSLLAFAPERLFTIRLFLDLVLFPLRPRGITATVAARPASRHR
jgi:AefR-like transcriptional repressor, C-terminal domain